MAARTQSAGDVLQEIMAVPYGQASGDLSPSGALNRTAIDDYVRCSVRNWSATVERNYVFEYISSSRGGQKTQALRVQQGDHNFNINEVREAHRNGERADTIENGVKVVPKAELTFDGRKFFIPASKDPKKEPEWEPIPQGVMDLYYGNPDRLASLDRMEAQTEIQKVRDRRRYDPCIRRNARGDNTNPFGFLEFKREIIEPKQVAIDSDQVYSDEYIEV